MNALLLMLTALAADPAAWSVFVANDNCPDYTWGLSEAQTRQAFADIIRGHLDEMRRTDDQPPHNRNRYNAAVTQEVLCFLEKYPERKDELIRRVKEGRLYISPYLCNTLWGLQSVEGSIRAFYPARRLQRAWGFPMDCAHHIEEPSLPWGTATILAGCGIRSLSVPFYAYDSTFGQLKIPPLFQFEGPDGSRIRVAMDRWACEKASYTQGAHVLRHPEAVGNEWVAHYAKLGAEYPLRAILAAGTHGDISPTRGAEARGFADAILRYNARPGQYPKLVNATYPMFWQVVDEELAGAKRELPLARGCFGHSWDLWPVSLANDVTDWRVGERRFLAVEALTALSGLGAARDASLQRDWHAAEEAWIMLADHAWNGTDEQNKRHNTELRRRWARDLRQLTTRFEEQAWKAIIQPDASHVVVFNGLSVPRSVATALSSSAVAPPLPEDNRAIRGFGFLELALHETPNANASAANVTASPSRLESPFYRVELDPKSGGVASLIHKPTGRELVAGSQNRTLGQTVYFDGKEHVLDGVPWRTDTPNPRSATARCLGTVAGIEISTAVTVFADLDHVRWTIGVRKPRANKEERLCHVFPIAQPGAALRIDTPAAVIRPRPQPEGDLLPGADRRRFAVQQFIDASTDDFGVTLATEDAFCLRLDLDPISFEALGNDQNYREVVRDQGGVEQFEFSYILRAHPEGYRNAETIAWAQSVLAPPLVIRGRLRDAHSLPGITVDSSRAVATSLKPADDGEGVILRLWETAGQSTPLPLAVRGYTRAIQTDLLERDLQPLPIDGGQVSLPVRAHGLCAVRLLR